MVHFKIKMPIMNFSGACMTENVLRASMRPLYNREESQEPSSFIPVLSWSDDALPADGPTACRSHHFSLPLWSPTLEPDWPTVRLWRCSPGRGNRCWVGASSRMLGCGRKWSWALSSQQPGHVDSEEFHVVEKH